MSALRPSSRDDDQAVLRVLAAREARDFGVADFVRGFLIDQWRVSKFEPATDAVVAEHAGVAVGYAALFDEGAIAFVDPEHERQGAGGKLLSWVEGRALKARRTCHRQLVAGSNERGHALLGGAGYRKVRSVIEMARTLEPLPEPPPIPAGVRLDQLDLAADGRAVHAADAASFAGNADYREVSFQSFYDEHLSGPGLEPGFSRVARRGDAIAGFTVCRRHPDDVGYVDLLAVDPNERGRGLGTALLLTAFADFASAGLREARLDVASDNPRGLRLYDRAGMTERVHIDVFEKRVDYVGKKAPMTARAGPASAPRRFRAG
jgi:mycothiol synthase